MTFSVRSAFGLAPLSVAATLAGIVFVASSANAHKDPVTAEQLKSYEAAFMEEVKKGDLVAVLSKTDPMGQPSDWWRCRARNGQMGYLPSPYLETIQRKPQQGQIAAKSVQSSPAHSRVNTMTGSTGAESRANSMKITEKEKAEVNKTNGGGEKQGIESFQRGGFYS